MDIKLQAYRGEAGPTDVDFRKSTGGFKGSPQDEHSTVAEVRIDDAEVTDTEERIGKALDELNAARDEGLLFAALGFANTIIAEVVSKVDQSQVAQLLESFAPGSGPLKVAIRAYDND